MLLTEQWMGGVVEGFYGQPWSRAERLELFDWMADWGLNAYLYAPKDDLKHRALWRQPYLQEEADPIRELIRKAGDRKIHFIYALAPGLDIRFSQPSELEALLQRCEQLLALGCRNFALLFDDIPAVMDATDASRFKSFAEAQAHVSNAVFRWTRDRAPQTRFLFCPTAYCGRMASRQLGGAGYLEILGRELLPEIQVMWTGPEIVSETIQASDLPIDQLRRKPVLWDNLHANDYDRSRFYCGPYSGRDSALRESVSGIFSNPNNEFPLNYVPLRTLGLYLHEEGEYRPREAFNQALREWKDRFRTVGSEITLEQLRLFADCYYLPHADGEEATAFFGDAAQVIAGHDSSLASFRAGTKQIREFCQNTNALQERPLFYALSQRVWDLREEIDLLERYADWRFSASPEKTFTSDFHLPKTYRGSFVRRLQDLLELKSSGEFKPKRSLHE